MLITNGIKVVGCMLMLFAVHPLLAYAVVGLGAAAYSPAKYGILTELLPAQQLVVANGWIEGTTVGVDHPRRADRRPARSARRSRGYMLGFDIPHFDTGIDTPPEAAIAIIAVFYVIAAVFNWYIPDTGVDHRVPSKNPFFLIREFSHCVVLLWRDKLGQISLATTTLFWGAGATLQFIVIDWAAPGAGLRPVAGVVPAGRGRGRHRRRRGARRALRRAAQVGDRAADRRRDGPHRDLDDLRHRSCRSRSC